LKINIKKVLFVLLFTEIMFMYYGHLEVREARRQVIQQENALEGKQPTSQRPEKPTSTPTAFWKKAS
jgi:hypothetical protein